ncbi:MAG: hypothetical protein KJO31_03930 [Gammaproteobacteria bacterium]|nr:hypothetical protein [Gammaproteobacteria bacterium]
MKRRDLACAIFVLAVTTGLGGCAAHEASVRSRLDSSGFTVETMGDPIVLSLPAPRLAASARDYAYLGPVEINHMGEREHYLWLGLASTVDRQFESVTPDTVDTMVLLVDGQPMILPLDNWVTSLDQLPYDTIAPLYATLAARASFDQIQRIASAESVEVHVITHDGSVERYRMWQGDFPSWSLLGNAE